MTEPRVIPWASPPNRTLAVSAALITVHHGLSNAEGLSAFRAAGGHIRTSDWDALMAMARHVVAHPESIPAVTV